MAVRSVDGAASADASARIGLQRAGCCCCCCCCPSRFTRRFTNWRLLCPARKSNCPVNQNVCQRSLNVRQIPEIGRRNSAGHHRGLSTSTPLPLLSLSLSRSAAAAAAFPFPPVVSARRCTPATRPPDISPRPEFVVRSSAKNRKPFLFSLSFSLSFFVNSPLSFVSPYVRRVHGGQRNNWSSTRRPRGRRRK